MNGTTLFPARTLRGDQLSPDQQREALARFAHRFTGDHRPDWASKKWKGMADYPLQFKDDRDWLAHTWFAVNKDGRISKRNRNCESWPTWPNNPELRKDKVPE
jgi:hypothetical protein